MSNLYKKLGVFILTVNLMLSISNLNYKIKAQSVSTLGIKEWVIPTGNSHPNLLEIDNGLVYFAEEYGNKIGCLDPQTGTFNEWTIPTTNSQPSGLAVYNGLIYFTERLGGKIGCLDPSTGVFNEWNIPIESLDNEVYNGLVFFVEGSGNKIGRLDPSTGTIDEWTIPTTNSWPSNIEIYNGLIYFTEKLGNKIGCLDPQTGTFNEWTIPTTNSWPLDIAIDNGLIYFTSLSYSKIGCLDPSTGVFNEWTTSGITYALDVSSGIVYFTEGHDYCYIGCLDPLTGLLNEWNIPGENLLLADIAVYNHLIYFTECNVGKIGCLDLLLVQWNLLMNPGFELILECWFSTDGTISYITDPLNKHYGFYSAKGIETNEYNLGRLYQDVTDVCVPGKKYKIGGWIKTENVVGNVVIGLD